MQTLHLRIENHVTLPNGGPVSLRLSGGSAQVGRKAGMDWVLPDPSRHISGHHFDITYQGGRYFLRDFSANGTFLHGERYRLDAAHEIRHGDRYTVGHYILRATLEGGLAAEQERPPHTPDSLQHAPSAAATDLDDWADLAPIPRPYPSGNMPTPLSGPRMPHAAPPPNVSQPLPPSGPPSLPMSPSATPPAAPQPDQAWGWNAAPLPQGEQHRRPQSSNPPPQNIPAAAPDAFLKGFLEGAGLAPDTELKTPPEDLGRMLGQSTRLCTQELMKMLTDRAAVKMFFSKEERTMLSASGNNPMKFMTDPNAALAALFVAPREGYQTGPDGFKDALTDIRQHQAAVVAALQPALADMMEGLSPEEIEPASDGGRFASKSKKNWEEFVKRWDAKATRGEHGMLDAFISAFAKHYADAKSRM